MTSGKCSINAPFTEDQVNSLNAYQISGVFHEYTCGTPGCREQLIATTDGWVCKKCAYKQNWAHTFTADWSWKPVAGCTKNNALKIILFPDSVALIGSPVPRIRFDQLMSNPTHKDWDQWQSFYNGWLEGRSQLYTELQHKTQMFGL